MKAYVDQITKDALALAIVGLYVGILKMEL
jgi:hypothetical protein